LWSGCLLTVISALLIVITIFLIFDAEEHLDERRAEYAASTKEYEDALMAYEADSARLHAQYQRIEKEIEAAKLRNDSNAVWTLEDSLLLYAEPEYHPRGAIGFNIAGAFYLLFIVFLLIPLVIGIILLLYYRYKKNKFTRASNELFGP
jgi:uncharacterized membrane protein